jgi:hypothetical protein
MAQNKAEMLITIDQNGQISVTGPINDKFISYAMLEAARDVVKDHHDKIARSSIVAPTSEDVRAIGLAGEKDRTH